LTSTPYCPAVVDMNVSFTWSMESCPVKLMTRFALITYSPPVIGSTEPSTYQSSVTSVAAVAPEASAIATIANNAAVSSKRGAIGTFGSLIQCPPARPSSRWYPTHKPFPPGGPLAGLFSHP
jgi:hypothetical protein